MHVFRKGSIAFLMHTRGRGSWSIFPGLELDGVLAPLNYIHLLLSFSSLKHTQSNTPCLFAGVWWEKVVCRWPLIGPQGPGEWVIWDNSEVVYVFESLGELGLNGKGLKFSR